MKSGRSWVAYFSPAGTTMQVAEIIAEEAEKQGRSAHLLNLAGPEADTVTRRIYEGFASRDILFVGSPTYAMHPVPRVMDFISGMPETPGAFAAPFVTYGSVTSGLALHDMAKGLEANNLGLLGGIKVVAVHSMVWQSDSPIGKGRPDEEDAAKIREFVRIVLKKADQLEPNPLSPDDLNYQGETVQQISAQMSLKILKNMIPPIELDNDACTQCGVCEEACPTANITLSPFPEFSDRCVLCFNCVRLCEPEALSNQVLPILEGEIRKHQEMFKETEETRFFT